MGAKWTGRKAEQGAEHLVRDVERVCVTLVWCDETDAAAAVREDLPWHNPLVLMA